MIPGVVPPKEEWDAEEQRYQANYAAARAQMLHEQRCAACAEWAQPATGKPRTGMPCLVGRIYWSVRVDSPSGARTAYGD